MMRFMGKRFLPNDVKRSLLFPPALHNWVPEGLSTRILVGVVSALDLRSIYALYDLEDGRGR